MYLGRQLVSHLGLFAKSSWAPSFLSQQKEPFRAERPEPGVSGLRLHQPARPAPTVSDIAGHQVSACSLYLIRSGLPSGFCFLLPTQELHSVGYLFSASGFCPCHSTEILNRVTPDPFVQSRGPSFLFPLTSWQHVVLAAKACCAYSPLVCETHLASVLRVLYGTV